MANTKKNTDLLDAKTNSTNTINTINTPVKQSKSSKILKESTQTNVTVSVNNTKKTPTQSIKTKPVKPVSTKIESTSDITNNSLFNESIESSNHLDKIAPTLVSTVPIHEMNTVTNTESTHVPLPSIESNSVELIHSIEKNDMTQDAVHNVNTDESKPKLVAPNGIKVNLNTVPTWPFPLGIRP